MRPGMCVKKEYSTFECCVAIPILAPMCVIRVRDTLTLPPDM